MNARAPLAALVMVLALTRTAAADLLYDFQWHSYARLSRWVAGDLFTTDGEMSDTAVLTLRRNTTGLWEFAFKGPRGTGHGVLAPRGPEKVVFPVAVQVGRPPAPPHLTGSWFGFTGHPDCPRTLQLEYADGFLCRTMPAACRQVNRWERHLSGSATLTRGDARCAQLSP
jgi:hypothetical protein